MIKKNKFSIKKLSRFFNMEIRGKIRAIERNLNIKIYPKYLKKNIIDKIKFRIIFSISMYQRIKRIKSYYKKNLYPALDQKFNFITTFPRSGTNYVSSVIDCYYELLFDIGNGEVKYNGLKDTYENNCSSLNKSTNIHNGINFFKQNYKLNEIQSKKYIKEIMFAEHFPLSDINTVYIDNITFVVIIRKQIFKSISSWYIMTKDINQKIDYSYVDSLIKEYLYFNNFWKENKLNLKYKIFYYEDLIDNENNKFLEIFNFFNISCSKEFLRTAIKNNDYGKIKKIIPEQSHRITNDKGIQFRKDLEFYIKKNLNN